ncbi:MAG: magnesium chelatase, partial [Actinobacteria bacterium]|nr:magnesium chelatase [Actinomycetota bacterium]
VAVPRIVDLWAVVPAALGRVEFDTLEEGNEAAIVLRQLRQAILDVFRRHLAGADLSGLVERFEAGLVVETGELVPAEDLRAAVGDLPALASWARALGIAPDDAAGVASVLEFVLEGLHLARRLTKDDRGVPGTAVYGS